MSMLFDDVSRIIASRISRREALALVSRTAGGAVLAALGLGKTAWGLAPPPYDDKHDRDDDKDKCKHGQVKCGGKCCAPRQTCCNGKCCSGPCCNGKKCCESDEVCCNGRCVDKRASKNGKCSKDDDD
jgi:hypothetical protein